MKEPIYTDYESVRQPGGRFGPGNCANPGGRPKGRVSGRNLALQTLDALLAEEKNQENLRAALQASFESDPVKFFKQIIMPLMPAEVKMNLVEETGFSWMSLPDTIRLRDSLKSANAP